MKILLTTIVAIFGMANVPANATIDGHDKVYFLVQDIHDEQIFSSSVRRSLDVKVCHKGRA